MAPDSESDLEPKASSEDDPLADLPTTFVPRWLAGVVLVALIAAGVLSAWLVICG